MDQLDHRTSQTAYPRLICSFSGSLLVLMIRSSALSDNSFFQLLPETSHAVTSAANKGFSVDR